MTDIHLPQFRTQRLSLRHLTDDDFSFMRELDTDPEVVKYLGHGKIRSEEETQGMFNRIYSSYEMFEVGAFIVEDAVTHEKLGRAGFIPWTLEGEFYWEIGYTFKPSAWGKGYATEVAQFLLNWGLENLNTEYLVCFIHPENINSLHVASKIGMNHWKEMMIGETSVFVYRSL